MKEIEITVGDRKFTMFTLKAFDLIKHGARLKGAFTKGTLTEGLDANAMQLLAGLDEKFVPDVIMPIMKDCVVVCTSEAKRVTTEQEVNDLYDADNIDEFFILVGKVLAENFGPAVKKTLARFGIRLDKLDLKKLIKSQLTSPSATTSTPK